MNTNNISSGVCPHCGEPRLDDAKAVFCTKCGGRVDAARYPEYDRKSEKTPKKRMLIIAAAAAMVALLVIAAVIFSVNSCGDKDTSPEADDSTPVVNDIIDESVPELNDSEWEHQIINPFLVNDLITADDKAVYFISYGYDERFEHVAIIARMDIAAGEYKTLYEISVPAPDHYDFIETNGSNLLIHLNGDTYFCAEIDGSDIRELDSTYTMYFADGDSYYSSYIGSGLGMEIYEEGKDCDKHTGLGGLPEFDKMSPAATFFDDGDVYTSFFDYSDNVVKIISYDLADGDLKVLRNDEPVMMMKYDSWLYYSNQKGELYRMNTDGSDCTLICSGVVNGRFAFCADRLIVDIFDEYIQNSVTYSVLPDGTGDYVELANCTYIAGAEGEWVMCNGDSEMLLMINVNTGEVIPVN